MAASEAPLYEKPPFLLRWAAPLLNDERDLPFIGLMFQCGVLVLSGIALYFVPERRFVYAALGHVLLWGTWVMDRFILMLHCTSHRALFRKEHKRLNLLIPWVIGPFMGEPPESYFAHHMGMHHKEGNLEHDLSSTMRYQRDRFSHWLHYFLSFITLTYTNLYRYHMTRGSRKLAKRFLIGEGSFWLLSLVLLFVNWKATLIVFIGPTLLVRMLMMVGNWGQHAFVCQEQPSNDFRSSITCINSRYNRRCFNDGYHINHHVVATAHWSEHPVEYEANQKLYGEQDAIVFDGLDFFSVWLLLMTKRWRALARAFVRLPGAPERDDEAVIQFLKSRLVPFAR
jgi:fatty acid desaturase